MVGPDWGEELGISCRLCVWLTGKLPSLSGSWTESGITGTWIGTLNMLIPSGGLMCCTTTLSPPVDILYCKKVCVFFEGRKFYIDLCVWLQSCAVCIYSLKSIRQLTVLGRWYLVLKHRLLKKLSIQGLTCSYQGHSLKSINKICHQDCDTPLFFTLFLGVLNMAALEESFPRGGTRKKSDHKSEKSFQQAAEQDNLFDVSGMLI